MVHKGVNFEAPNALKLMSTFNFKKNFRGLYPRTSVKRGRGGKGRRGRGQGRGGPQFTFLATPLPVLPI